MHHGRWNWAILWASTGSRIGYLLYSATSSWRFSIHVLHCVLSWTVVFRVLLSHLAMRTAKCRVFSLVRRVDLGFGPQNAPLPSADISPAQKKSGIVDSSASSCVISSNFQYAALVLLLGKKNSAGIAKPCTVMCKAHCWVHRLGATRKVPFPTH